MSDSLFLCLRDGVSAARLGDSELVVDGGSIRITLRQLRPGTVVALERLASLGAAEDELADYVRRTDGADVLAKFYHYLYRLALRGLLLRSATDGRVRLATEVPLSGRFAFMSREAAYDQPYILSRFAYLRRERDELVLESALAHARIILHDSRAVTIVHAFAKAHTLTELSLGVGGLSLSTAAAVVKLLLNSGMLQELNAQGRAQEDETASQYWEFHDLLLHVRSRVGADERPVGSALRLRAQLDQLSALKSNRTHESFQLYHPDLDKLQEEDPPFALVQEMRRSVREYAARPITGRQLGEFLYRVARARELKEIQATTPSGSVKMSVASRPYPSGGASYELELYAVINNCEDVVPGMHYYDPLLHRLCKLSGRTHDVEKLLQEAGASAQIAPGLLQVLLIVTARLPRISWKYAGLAYSLVLKNVGVLYQTMYLAATAMGLAPCALGCGDAYLFARAADTDYSAESSVGEFLLGSKT